jgi:hypothetical protein
MQESARTSLDQIHRELVNRPFQFQERCQDFFGAHDEALSVAMRVNKSRSFAPENPQPTRSPNSIRLC